MIRPFAIHGVDQPDDSWLFGFFDPFELVARYLLTAAGANPIHVNTGLSESGWEAILRGGAISDISTMAAEMGTVLASKDAAIPSKVKQYDTLKTTANGLWNVLATLGEMVPLHADGLESGMAVYPEPNPKGGFVWLSGLNALRPITGPAIGAPEPRRLYTGAKWEDEAVTPNLAAWQFHPFEVNPKGERVSRGEITDRAPALAQLAERVGRFEIAVNLGKHATLERMWGPAIFGDNRDRQPQAVQLQRCINVRFLGLAYGVQPLLLIAHSIREWLFGGVGSFHPVEAELARSYSKADVDFLREQLDRVCSLPMSPFFAYALERIGWRTMATPWGDKPTCDLPVQIRELVNGGARGDAALPGAGILGRSGPLSTFVEELFSLVTASYFKEGYTLATTIMGGGMVPQLAKKFLPAPHDPLLAYTDGVHASATLGAQDIWAVPMFRPDRHVGGFGTPPVVRPINDGMGGMIIVADAHAQLGAGWMHETGTPLYWRPFSEYQGDVDAIRIDELTLKKLAEIVGTTPEALSESIVNNREAWSHLVRVTDRNGQLSLLTDSIFRSARTEKLYKVVVAPEVIGPSLYLRWRDGKPVITNKGVSAAAGLVRRSWHGLLTAELPTLEASASGAVSDLLSKLGVANASRTAVAQ